MTYNEQQHLQVILNILNMIFAASKPQTDVPAEKVAASAVAAASGSHSARCAAARWWGWRESGKSPIWEMFGWVNT